MAGGTGFADQGGEFVMKLVERGNQRALGNQAKRRKRSRLLVKQAPAERMHLRNGDPIDVADHFIQRDGVPEIQLVFRQLAHATV